MLKIHKRDCTNTIEVPILGKVYAESPSGYLQVRPRRGWKLALMLESWLADNAIILAGFVVLTGRES